MKPWPLLLLLAGCSDATPTPNQCRAAGVDVPPGAPITGVIAAEHVADSATVQARCLSPFRPQAGCALAVAPGEYVIWTIDDARVLLHERCHALFEVKGHP